MTSLLVCLCLDRAVRVRSLAGTLCCSWARHFTITVALSFQVCKRVPSNLMLGLTLRWTSIPFRGKDKTLLYRNWDTRKLWSDRPLG